VITLTGSGARADAECESATAKIVNPGRVLDFAEGIPEILTNRVQDASFSCAEWSASGCAFLKRVEFDLDVGYASKLQFQFATIRARQRLDVQQTLSDIRFTL
jgi:hypothetical protein